MALHEVRTPDGQILKINAPDDASEEDILGFAQSQYKPLSGQKRSFTEAVTDVGGGFISGVGSLLQIPGQVGQLAGITEREETPTGLQGVGKQIEEFGQELKSPVLKGKEAVRAQRVAAAGEEGGFKGIASQFGTAIKETITDPALLTSFFAEQIPNLFGSMGGGLLARGGVKLLMREASEVALGKAGVAGAVGTGAVMQGADVGADTYEAIYKRLIAENKSPEEANRLALTQGRQAALQAAGISLATAALPGGRSIERALAGKGAPSVGGVARGFFGEAGSEALEEGGGQFVSNVAQQEIFPDIKLSQNVGQAAGMGALGGGLFGGVAGGVNARNEAQRQTAINEIEQQRQLTLQAEEATRVAEYQARADAEQARLAEISHRGWVERGGPTNTKAFADLTAQVEELKTKAAASAARANVARDKVDAQKAQLSAFSQTQPDLLGDVLPPRQTAATQEPVQQGVPAAPEGQLELPLNDQLGLPGIGGAINPPTAAPTPEPVESMLVTQDLTKALGISGGNKKVRNAIEGKDLTDPKQRAEVREALEGFAGRTTSPGVASNIETFLGLPVFAEQNELTLPMRRVSAKQRAAAKTEELSGLFGAKLAQTEGVKTPSQELPYQREGKTTEDKLQNVFGNQLRQTEGIPVPDNLLPHEREAANVAPNQPTAAQPAAQQPAGEQGVGVASVGAGPTTQQTSAAAGVQGAGSTGLAPATAGTQRNVRGTEASSDSVNGRTPTVIQQREAFAKNLGAARPYRGSMKGRKNAALAKAVANGDIQGAIEALAQSKNKVIAEFAKRLLGTNVRPNIIIDDNAIELYNVRDETTQQVTIDSSKTAIELLDVLRGLRSKVETLPNDNSYLGDIGDTKVTEYDSLSPSGDTTKSVSSFINSKQLPVYIYVPENKFETSSKGKFLFYLNRLEEVVADIGEAKIRRNATATAQSVGVVGSYDAGTNTIGVPEYFAGNEDIVGHELVHAEAINAIANPAPNQRSAVKRFETLFKHVQEHVAKNNDALFPYYKNGDVYGLSSIQEFAAEGISNPSFQFLLSSIPYENTSAWGKFVKTIAEMLGIKNVTAFTEFLNLYDEITNQNLPAEKQKAKVVTVTEASPAPVELTVQKKNQLDYFAGDIALKEAGTKAKYKKLSSEEKAYVDAKVAEYKNMPKAVVETLVGKSTPALTAAVQKGNVTYALSEIANGKGFSPLEQAIAKRLLSNKRYSLPKIKIVPAGSLGRASGQYDPYTDTISIVEGAVDSHTILHEAVHGFVHALITKFESGEVSNRALVDLQDLYTHLLQNNPELADQYGMGSLTEFAAEAMSNPDFQAALARIPYKKRNVFQEFAKFIMDLLELSGTNNALAEAIINVERAMNIGRGTQENVSGTAKAPPIANVTRKADLEALNTAAGGRPTGKGNPNPVGSAITQNAKASEANATRRVTTFLDAFETGALSFDAALNNSIRRELNKDKKDWNVIKDVLTKISTSQALYSDAMAMQFLEHGGLTYDPKTYKFFAVDEKDSWKNMMALMSRVAKDNGLTDTELRTYANTAFIAERVEGLAKSNPEFHKHLTPQQTAAGKQLFDKIDGLRDVQTMWNGIRKNAMDVAVEHGLYSREQANDLLKYMDFVPFYREDQLEVGAGPRKYPNGFIDFAKNFKIKGSDQPVSDVFGNMALWTTYTVSRAVRNRAALNMYGAVKEVMPDQVEDIRQDESVKREDNVVSFWEDGQRKRVKFADPLFVHAFEGMETVALPLLKNLAKATNFLRQSIVLNPLFSISQLSQDSFAAMISSGLKNPLMIPLEVVRQFNSILFGRNVTGKYLSRAGVVGIPDYMSAISSNNLEIATGLKQKSMFRKLLSPLEQFSMASDNAVRQALYNRTLLETGGKRQKDGSVVGGDEAAAMERAFEIINFKRSGANGAVNFGKQLVPFFGAYLQAMNVTAKVLSGRSITPTERAAAYKTLMWNTMMVTTLAFLYSAMVSGDDDYEKMDPQIRDKHLVIPGTSFMLPLRNDFTLFPKLAAEYSYLMMTDNGFTDGKKVRRAMGDALANAVLSPTAVPQAIKPALEVGINHNFFTGREVVGKGIAGRDKELQYTEATSELGKFLGKMGVLAPVQIDHLIKGYAGTVGGLGLMLTNAVMSQGNAPKPEKATQDELRQIPGMGTFFASSHGNAMKNDYYELREEVASAVKSMNFLKDKSPAEAQAYIKEKMPLLQLQGPINNINNQLTKIRKYEAQIRALPESRMNAAEKKATLDRLKESEDRMLKNVYKLRNMAGY